MPFSFGLGGSVFRVVFMASLGVQSGEVIQGRGYRMLWEAPPECPRAEAVQKALDRALGPTSEPDLRPVVDVRVAIARSSAAGWRMRLDRQHQVSTGSRVIEAATCEELANAAALIVAIGVEPGLLEHQEAPKIQFPDGWPESGRGSRQEGPWPGPDFGPPPLVVSEANRQDKPRLVVAAPQAAALPAEKAGLAPKPPRPVRPAAQTPASTRAAAREDPRLLGVSVRATAGVALEMVSHWTGAVEVGLVLHRGPWRAELLGSYRLPRTLKAPSNDSVSGRYQLGALGLRGCVVPRTGSVEFPLCAGLESGVLRGEGQGGQLARTYVAHQPWLALRAGVNVAWRVHSRLALWLGGDGAMPLLIPRFRTDRTATVFELPAVGGLVLGGLEVRVK